MKTNYPYSLNFDWAKNIAEVENAEVDSFELRDGDDYCFFHYVKRDISKEITGLAPNKWFDIATPFDYGGIYYTNEQILRKFMVLFSERCRSENIVTGFFRFNPLVPHDFDVLSEFISISHVQDHIVILLTENPRSGFTKKKIRDIKKAEKCDIRIDCEASLEDFFSTYIDSMDRRKANEFYYFDKSKLINLAPFLRIFSLKFDGKSVTSAVIIEDPQNIYYFLSGTLSDYLHYGFNSLLIDRICKHYYGNKKHFYLGGGKNGVYDFKRRFSSETRPFFIGKKVFNPEIYDELNVKTNRVCNNFFPKYREKVI